MTAGKRKHPVVWVIGATRSCKSALAENGIAPLGFKLISTATYFRNAYGQPDTMDRAFVFNISAHAALTLADNPDCHRAYLEKLLKAATGPCVVEGERNPVEFAKLYDPAQDMVFLIERLDVDKYDTVIERGIGAIEQIMRWNVSTGITPQESVMKVIFGLDEIRAEHLGVNNGPDHIFLQGPVKQKKSEGMIEDRYPWINILIGLVREQILHYYDSSVGNAQSILAPSP